MSMQIKYNQTQIIQYLLIYLMIEFIGGRLPQFFGTDLFYLFCIGISFFCMIAFKEKIPFSKSYFNSVIIIGFFLIFTYCITGGALSFGTIAALIARFLLIYVSIKINQDMFALRFLRLVYLMAMISLVEFAVVNIVGEESALELFSYLPKVKNSVSWLGSSYGTFPICYNFMDVSRNTYIFGEPGEYQYLMVCAICFLLFNDEQIDKKSYVKYFVVFVITLITTQSTTGYINLIAISICIMVINKNRIPHRIKKIFGILVIVGGIYLVIIPKETNVFYTAFMDKIINTEGKLDLATNTGAARVGPIIRFLAFALESPLKLITGVGFSGLSNTPLKGYSTGGLINCLAMFGLVTTFIILGRMFSSLSRNAKSWLEIVLIIFIIINQGLSQPDFLPILSPMLCFYKECSHSGYLEVKRKTNYYESKSFI